MKAVILTQGKIAVVDDADFEGVSQFKWYAVKNGWYKPTGRKGWDARRCVGSRPHKKEQRMHHFILGTNQLVDHKNGDGLWNTRDNLRLADKAKNQYNKRPSLKASRIGRMKGTYFDKRRGVWESGIGLNGKKIHLGRFSTEREAADAYDAAAVRLYGEFALTNAMLRGES